MSAEIVKALNINLINASEEFILIDSLKMKGAFETKKELSYNLNILFLLENGSCINIDKILCNEIF
jgi:hypothetical protein